MHQQGIGLLRPALLAAWIASGLASMPATAQTADAADADALNYAFASQLGSGIYQISGHTVQVYRLPFQLPVRPARDRSPTVRLTAPVCVGFFDLDGADRTETPEHVATASFVPGIAVEFVARPDWRLEPFAEFGIAQDFHDRQRAYLYAFGVRSLATFRPRALRVRLGHRVVYAGEHTPGSEYDDDFAMLESGVEILRPLPVAVKGHGLDWGPYVMSYLYIEPTKVYLEEKPLEAGAQYEVGLTFGPRSAVPLWRLEVPRLGLGYRFGDGVEAFRLVLGEAF